ncbi:unnamed protein product [Chrysodeixis includens]|uniref:Major facilitator superfamily (MFS) profile domain-containing protein n=1 Tax=Chrysodeixis includens TaxID=689277 RepID=A0A9P0BNM5_CHRIL|nr:unnamed protein product [Chrysodeixis includens]
MEAVETSSQNRKAQWKERKHFMRQILISSGGWSTYFIMGISFGAPTVFIPQIRNEANSTAAVSEETASWIPAILVYSGLPWAFILPILMKYIGRKYSFGFVSFSNLISFILFYFSTTVNHILISEVINGINTGSHFTVSVMIITEYASPKHRGFFLTMKSATLFWGIFLSNAVGTFFHWRNIGLVGILVSVYSLFIFFLMPESPFWLASKQRYDQSSLSHRWVLGKDKESEAALEKLINYQLSVHSNKKPKDFELKTFLAYYLNVVSSKQFYMPLTLSFFIQCLYVFSGKVVFAVYAIDIISKITAGSKMSPYTAMLILDGVTVFCMYVGCGIVKLFTRRKLLISTSLTGISFLLAMSLYAFLIKLSVIEENNYLALTMLIGYSISICIGPVILTQTIVGELVPIENRGLASCCIDVSLKILLGTVVKISPLIFKAAGTHGAFLFYGVSTSIFLVLLYKFLPETKDRTLQEIAELMKGKKHNTVSQEETAFVPDAKE